MIRRHLLLLAVLLAFLPATALGPALGLAGEAPGGEVRAVIDGDTLVLADGREVRLVGLQAPKLPLGRQGFKAWPLAAQSKAALAAITLGREVTLSQFGRGRDRHNRVLAHLHTADGVWVQGKMLADGMARVYSFADNRARVDEMLALEGRARAGGHGIWADPFYAILSHTEAGGHIGSFQLVEGRIAEVAVVKGRTYLNFTEDWKTDFTVTMAKEAAKTFKQNGFDPLTLKGKRIRVRGWLKSRNGPMIEATHPEQIEVLDP